jgi:hypothetical protein
MAPTVKVASIEIPGHIPARSHILLSSVKGRVERETGFEPATFCLGSSGRRALWHEREIRT